MLSSFSIWDWSQIIGTLLVVIGVAGELILLVKKFRYNPTNFPPVESLKRKLEILSVVILLVGLVLEVIALPHSLLEAAKLEQSNLELQAKLQQRVITPKKAKDFIFLTDKLPKFPISICMGGLNDETLNYAAQFRLMLTEAGYEIPDSDKNFPQGVHINQYLLMWSAQMGNTNEWPAVSFITDDTNELSHYYYHYELTNGFCRPIVIKGEASDTAKTFAAISFVFSQMGITYNQVYSTDWVGTNHWLIFIRQKPQ